MALAYEEALTTLQGMFSDVSPDVIAAVLEAHQGHMEATVETLLSMTGGGVADPTVPGRDLAAERAQQEEDEHLARQLQAEFNRQQQPPIVPAGQTPAPQGAAEGVSSFTNRMAPATDTVSDRMKTMGEAAKRNFNAFTNKIANMTSTKKYSLVGTTEFGGDDDNDNHHNRNATADNYGTYTPPPPVLDAPAPLDMNPTAQPQRRPQAASGAPQTSPEAVPPSFGARAEEEAQNQNLVNRRTDRSDSQLQRDLLL
eukprot:jgi/Chlat1/6365/Chrsp44S05830